jgi:anion-transporting  ArsA/GET3 family ATPase
LGNLTDARILLVTGKGGVGKTTVCATLGLWLSQRGQRTIIAETSGATQIAPLFGIQTGGYKPVQIRPGLSTVSITPQAAIEDYVVQQVRFRRLYKMVFRNRVMGPFIDAVPGLHDAVQLGKVFDLDRQRNADGTHTWDTIIVDAPATGHGLTMLAAPSAMMELTRSGPMYEGVKLVQDVIGSRARTAIVLVSLPEDLPTSETLQLYSRLGPAKAQLVACVLNQVMAPPLAHREDWAVARQTLSEHPAPAIQEAVGLIDNWYDQLERQKLARARLEENLPVPVLDLPRLPTVDLSTEHLHDLSNDLGASFFGGAE